MIAKPHVPLYLWLPLWSNDFFVKVHSSLGSVPEPPVLHDLNSIFKLVLVNAVSNKTLFFNKMPPQKPPRTRNISQTRILPTKTPSPFVANAQSFVPYNNSVSAAGNPRRRGLGGFGPAASVPNTAVSTEAALGSINVGEYEVKEYPSAGGSAIVLTPCRGRTVAGPSPSFAEQLQGAVFAN